MINSLKRAGGVSLRELLPEAQFLTAGDVRVVSCSSDSRRVRSGDLFAALPGVEHDGHEFAREALTRGAGAFLAERFLPVGGRPLCLVEDARAAYGKLCQALAGNPSERLKVIGVTGTNGKTTTTSLTASILAAAGNRVGTMGTLGIDDLLDVAPASLTTPPAETTARALARMEANHASHAVMEVSSHALSQSRVRGIHFDAVCVTNIRRDHLDYHGTLESYRQVKGRILDHLSPDGVAILNIDDPACARMCSQVSGPLMTFGMSPAADVTARVIERHLGEQTFLLHYGSETAGVRTQMIGDHHVYNALCAAAVGLSYGVDLQTVARGIESVAQVPGRMQTIACGQPFAVFIDYAHTPDALVASLRALREVTENRVICVFGAGGDRDRQKRPLMGAAVERHADVAIITSDNPRTEDPLAIAQDIQSGFEQPVDARVVLDRSEAIAAAIEEALPGDTVLIAGKGHEDYQDIGRRRYYFDDREITHDLLYRMAPEESYV